jgi:hypothetical protein
MKSYTAHGDPTWRDGHFVEEWEQAHIDSLVAPLKAILHAELKAGNRVASASSGYPAAKSNVWLAQPPRVAARQSTSEVEYSRSETPHDRYECFEHAPSQAALLFPLA